MTTHINRYSIALIGSFAIATFAFTHPLSADSGPDVRKVIKVMDAMCLSIAENQIMVEANGTLSMFPMRLAAGAKVQATYQSRDVAEFFEGASAKIKSDQADAVRDCMKPQIAKVLSMLEGKPIPPLNVNYSKDSGNINNSVNNTNSNNRNYNNNNSVTNNNNTVNNNAVNNNNNSVNNSNNYNNSVRNRNSGNINNSVNNSNNNSRNVTKIGDTVQNITHNNYAAPAQSQVAAIVKRNFFVLPLQFPKNLAASFGNTERRDLQDIIQLSLRTVPNSRISGKGKPQKADSRIYSAIVKFKENRVKNPKHAGVSVVNGLFGSLGAKLTEGIEPFVPVIDVEVSISSENRQTGDTIRETGRAYIRTDKFENTQSAYREALANAVTDGANRLTSRIVGDVPEPWRKPELFQTAVFESDKND